MTQLSGGPGIQTPQRHNGERLKAVTPSTVSSLKNGSTTDNDTHKNTDEQIIPEKEVLEITKTIVSSQDAFQTTLSTSVTNPKDEMKDPKILTNADTTTIINNNTMTAVPLRHREMAVDVPDTFVAVAKTTPRYPPPQKKPPVIPVDTSSSLKKNKLYTFSSEPANRGYQQGRQLSCRRTSLSSQNDLQGSMEHRTPPTPRISELEQDSKNEDVVKNGGDEKLIDLGQLQRIWKYQEDIRKRKEDEERTAKEDEFLRSSLRGSQKLRALEKQRKSETGTGLENSAFTLEEGDTLEENHSSSGGGTLVASSPDGEPPELKVLYDYTHLLFMLSNIKSLLSNTGFKDSLLEIKNLLLNPEFQSLLNLHNKIQDLCCFKCLPTPVCTDAQVIELEVIESLHVEPSEDGKELLHILGKHSFEGLMFCHDRVAAKQVTPDRMMEEEELLTRLAQYSEESIKVVRIEKTTEPLGATVKNDGEAVIVGRIIKGGIAEKSGLLHEGDEILEVNGLELRGKSVNDVCDIMAAMSGTLTFLIVPTLYDTPKRQTRESVIHLKAHFDYEPEDDLYVPCRELGMSFQKGDVLHVISQEDPNWWQAYREGEEDQLLAGLIPSKNFQQQREIMKQAVVGDTRERKSKKGKFLCAKRLHRRKKKKLYNLSYGDDTDVEQVLTYEEVKLYYPRAHQKRPLVLIGPQKVGRHELRQKLMEDTSRFAAAVPHTSRTKKDSEMNGVDYFFISRSQFEADIVAGRFVEHGEYQKSYYGTSLDAIRSVIEVGKTCVLNLHPQSLKILKKSDLMPYIVFIAPPALEKLRINCLKMDISVKDDELKDIIEKAREMEEFYGHYFDLVLINVDLEKTFSQLLHEISVIEREPQWVPASWIKDDVT